jgi:hypothetical protein
LFAGKCCPFLRCPPSRHIATNAIRSHRVHCPHDPSPTPSTVGVHVYSLA